VTIHVFDWKGKTVEGVEGAKTERALFDERGKKTA
jgi:hypothetical protein